MADAAKRLYWDACAWIGLINEEADKHGPLRILWAAAQKGQYEIWTSTYSYVEVLAAKNAHGAAYPPEESDQRIFAVFDQAHVKRAQLDIEVAKLARKLKRDNHPQLSKRSDAIHLATALYYDAEELHTWDKSDLLGFDKKFKCLKSGKVLPILIPGPETHGPLFAEKHDA